MSFLGGRLATLRKVRRSRNRDVLVAAYHLRHGPRQDSYGHPSETWAEVAKVWSVLAGVDITPERAVLMMTALKVVRANRRHDFDDLADAASYLSICQELRDN